jgi:DNA-directed RNA polymerase subunit RPC12/RpoP
MRIIEQKTYVEPEVEETCRKCQTKFAYTKNDVNHDRDGSYVNCPSCGNFIAAKSTLKLQ